MILTRQDGIVANTPDLIRDAQAGGFTQCSTHASQFASTGNQCPFWMSSTAAANVEHQGGGYYTCPVCRRSHDLMHHLPWHGVTEEAATQEQIDQWSNPSGGATKIGITMTAQGQIGEQVVRDLSESNSAFTQRYGKVQWWPEAYNSPLDGATQDWGLEVKSIGADALHHRFIPGSAATKATKDQAAAQKGLKGVLGILVILNYRTSTADVYVKEHPLQQGIGAFRSSDFGGQYHLATVPFKSPFLDPHEASPVKHDDLPF